MFGHFPELVIILALALIVFGPEKLPEMAASAGKMVREFRDLMDGAIHPPEHQVPEDFTQYYYESLARAGEPGPDDLETTDDELEAPAWEEVDGVSEWGTDEAASSRAETSETPAESAATHAEPDAESVPPLNPDHEAS